MVQVNRAALRPPPGTRVAFMLASLCLALIALAPGALAVEDPQPSVLVFTSNAYDGVARAEDAITVRFDAGTAVIQAPACGFPGMRRTAKVESDFGGRRWTCIITVDPADPDGAVSFSAASQAAPGAAAVAVSSTNAVARVSRVPLRIDNTAPAPSSLAIISSGERPLTVNVGEVATLTYVAREAMTSLQVTFTGIAASRVSVVGSGQSWQAFFTVEAGDPTGVIAFSARATDLAGNVHTATAAPDGPAEITAAVDSSPPQVEAVTLASSHSFNSSYAVVGTVMTLSMKFRESVRTPEVTVLSSASGSAKMSITGLVDTYVGTYTISVSDKQGPFAFLMEYRDSAGNIGTPVGRVTAGPTAIIDTVRPTISAIAQPEAAVAAGAAGAAGSVNTKVIRLGEILAVRPSLSEPVLSLTVTVRGLRTAPVVVGTGQLWAATVPAAVNDTEGEVTYQIDATDFAGNGAIRYSGKGPIRPVCGTSVAVEGEICDGDPRCTANCTCAQGFYVDPTDTSPPGQLCRAGPMIAVVDRPARVDSAQLREYTLELWENAHAPPTSTFGKIDDWLALPSSTGPRRARSIALGDSNGWSACAVSPTIGHTAVNLSFVVVEGPSSKVLSRQTAAASASPGASFVAAAAYATNPEGASVWDLILRAAASYPWAEPDGFTLNGTRAVAARFPNSTASRGETDVDANTFARYVLAAAGIAWPSVAPIGTTTHRARLSPRNRIDFFCNSAPVANASIPCSEIVGANNANKTLQADPCTIIVPLVSFRLAQIAPPLTVTAFAKELELAVGIEANRIDVRTLAVLPTGARRRSSIGSSSDSDSNSISVSSSVSSSVGSSSSSSTISSGNVGIISSDSGVGNSASDAARLRLRHNRHHRRRRSHDRGPLAGLQAEDLPTEDPNAPTVLVEFVIRDSLTDPLALGALSTLTDAVDAVDQSAFRRRRLFIRDYNVEDLTRRPPVEPTASPVPGGSSSGSNTSRNVIIVIFVLFGLFIIGLGIFIYLRRKKEIEMASKADHDDKVADAQFNEFPWKAGEKGTPPPDGLPEFGETHRKLTAAKGKLAELPMISFANRVKDKERKRREEEGPGGLDDLEFTSQSLARTSGSAGDFGSTTPPPPLSATRTSRRDSPGATNNNNNNNGWTSGTSRSNPGTPNSVTR
jgi:hypothetical protein